MTYVLFNIKRYDINITFWVFWMIIALYPIATIMGFLSINKDRLPLEQYPQLSVYLTAWPIHSVETSGTYLFNMIVSIRYSTVPIRNRLVSVQRRHHPGKQRRQWLIGWMKKIDLAFLVNLVSLKLFICSNNSLKMRFLVHHNIPSIHSYTLFLIIFGIKSLLSTHLRQVEEI